MRGLLLDQLLLRLTVFQRRANHEGSFGSQLLFTLHDLLFVFLECSRLVRAQKLRARAVRAEALRRLLLVGAIALALPRRMVLLATVDAAGEADVHLRSAVGCCHALVTHNVARLRRLDAPITQIDRFND